MLKIIKKYNHLINKTKTKRKQENEKKESR